MYLIVIISISISMLIATSFIVYYLEILRKIEGYDKEYKFHNKVIDVRIIMILSIFICLVIVIPVRHNVIHESRDVQGTITALHIEEERRGCFCGNCTRSNLIITIKLDDGREIQMNHNRFNPEATRGCCEFYASMNVGDTVVINQRENMVTGELRHRNIRVIQER